MKLLIYGINYWPELTGIGKYSGEMAEWLAARGHDIEVITAPPYYPQWRIHSGYNAWRYQTEIQKGVRIHRCPLWVPEKLRLSTRLLHLLSFAFSSFPVLFRRSVAWRQHVILVIEPSLFCAPATILVARLISAHAWLHIQDSEIDAVFDLGLVRSNLFKKIIL